MYKVGSDKFRLTTRKETKIGLTHLDKKRITHPELTYAPGHYRLRMKN